MSDDEEDVVYVVPYGRLGRRPSYHTDPDCVSLRRADRVLEKPRHVIDGHRDECKRCSGDLQNHRGGHASVGRVIEDPDFGPEDLGLEPMRTDGGEDDV